MEMLLVGWGWDDAARGSGRGRAWYMYSRPAWCESCEVGCEARGMPGMLVVERVPEEGCRESLNGGDGGRTGHDGVGGCRRRRTRSIRGMLSCPLWYRGSGACDEVDVDGVYRFDDDDEDEDEDEIWDP